MVWWWWIIPSFVAVIGLAIGADRAFQQKDFADLAYLVPNYGKEANVTQPTKRAAQ